MSFTILKKSACNIIHFSLFVTLGKTWYFSGFVSSENAFTQAYSWWHCSESSPNTNWKLKEKDLTTPHCIIVKLHHLRHPLSLSTYTYVNGEYYLELTYLAESSHFSLKSCWIIFGCLTTCVIKYNFTHSLLYKMIWEPHIFGGISLGNIFLKGKGMKSIGLFTSLWKKCGMFSDLCNLSED